MDLILTSSMLSKRDLLELTTKLFVAEPAEFIQRYFYNYKVK
ncbi:hypothetical protein N480_21640 [Pseudoalteromonas luteoviolacea S2607]|nr:hypothetical protein N480_21640 [Pseudoalteromonas luteoviolacea S2607]